MNITFFTPTLKLSGGNIVMFKYAEALVSFGHNVTVIAPHDIAKEEIKNGVRIKTFKKFSNKYFEHIFFQLIYLNKFYELTPDSDIIIPIFFPLVVHAIFCKKKGKTNKIISLFQDFRAMWWFGPYIYFLLGQKFITSQIDKFIAVSNPTAEEIRKVTDREVVVVPNEVEHEFFYFKNLRKEDYILFVGSSSRMKGLKYFIKAFRVMKKDYPDIKAKVVASTPLAINDSNIEVINIGSDRNKLSDLYSKALVFVSQSLGDSFGLPPLEAMACGTAVVLTNTVGAMEYAVNEENSLIVPIKNPKLTASAVVRILQDECLRKHIETNGLRTASRYTHKILIDKLGEIISC